MSTPLVSIIIPVYKVEPYLRRCLDSVVNQTYRNLEIILVDDGSPDNCPQICDEYAARDSRIVVIHKPNGGLSDARNTGLDIAKGDYISFVDSDDWVDMKYVEQLYRLLRGSKANIAVGGFDFASESGLLEKHASNRPDIEILDSRQAVAKLFSSDELTFVVAWGKLFHSSLFDGIRFPKGKLYEDEYVTYKVLYASHKTAFLDIPLYSYLQRTDSIMGKTGNDSLRRLEMHGNRYRYFKERNERELCMLCNQFLCWDLLFAYGRLEKGISVPGFNSVNEALQQFRTMVEEGWSLGNRSAQMYFLKFFSSFPRTYLLYRAISPYKLRQV